MKVWKLVSSFNLCAWKVHFESQFHSPEMKNYYQIVDTFTAELKGSSSLLQKWSNFYLVCCVLLSVCRVYNVDGRWVSINMEQCWNDDWQGVMKVLRKSLSHCLLIYHISHIDCSMMVLMCLVLIVADQNTAYLALPTKVWIIIS
jgi:hypothetical protein